MTKNSKNILAIVVLLFTMTLWAWVLHADSSAPRKEFRFKGSWILEVAAPSPVTGVVWKVEKQGVFIDGMAAVQARAYDAPTVVGCLAKLDGSGICKRLRLIAEKPVDKSGSFKVQFPGRTFGKSGQPGLATIEIVFNELSLDDYGQMSFQVVMEGATDALFGVLNLNTHEQDTLPAATAALQVDGQNLADGAAVKAGWHFLWLGPGKKVGATEDPTDLLSLCINYPDDSYECSRDNTLQIWVKKRGDYEFSAWNKSLSVAKIKIRGV